VLFNLDLKSPKVSSLDHLFSHPPQVNTVYDAGNPYKCVLKSPPKHQWALARIIVFQCDGGQQLKNLLTHYGQVLPYDSIVIIDHKGQDNATVALMNQYSNDGVHVWRCDGEWKHKSFMWDFVINSYKAASDFVFLLDINELVTVIHRDENEETIEWNQIDFFNVLDKLGREGKSFKMESASPIPPECPINMEGKHNASIMYPPSGYTGEMCQIKYIKRKHREKRRDCYDKSFVRGENHYSTDTGNHDGKTQSHRGVRRSSCFNNPEAYFKLHYEAPNLLLLHVQALSFSTWLVHGLRGVATYGFN